MAELAIALLGAAGRMGQAVRRQAKMAPGMHISGAWVRRADDRLDAECELPVSAKLDTVLEGATLAIDFTLPAATLEVLAGVTAHAIPLVSGTTGLESQQQDALQRAAASIPVVYDRNMSAGVHVLTELVRRAAGLLKDDYDVEVCETHHRSKIDAPSGTALKLGEAIAAERGIDFDSSAVYSRYGSPGERRRGSIGFTSVRAGGIVGEHAVLFASETDRIEIAHHAESRDVFAAGALRAARWIVGRPPGLYTLRDVLDL